MNKRLIIQVNVKPQNVNAVTRRSWHYDSDLYDLSIQQAKKYAEKYNSDYLLLTDCSYLPEKHPTFQRFKMYELTGYEQIMYLDCDAVILDSSPDIFTLCEGHKFSAVPDHPWDNPSTYYENIRVAANKKYGASGNYRPFCAGVMVVSDQFIEETRELLTKYIDAYDNSGYDQSILNKMVVDLGETYHELSPDWGAWYKKGKHIIHLVGKDKKNLDIDKFCKLNGLTREL